MNLIMQSVEQLASGDIFGYLLDLFTQVIPAPILALFVFGAIGVGYYMTQRTVAIPLVMVLMIGGVTLTEFPPSFQSAIGAALVVAIAGLAFIILQRFRT
jgi:hypothetical protein